MSFRNAKRLAIAASAVLASGCATAPGEPNGLANQMRQTFASDDPCSNNARNIGIAGGALLGILIGNSSGKGNTQALATGALVGGLIGGLIGADMDRRRCELAKVAKAHNLDIVMTDITLAKSAQDIRASEANDAKKPDSVGMSFTIIDRGNQFASGSPVPSADAVKAFGDVAEKYRVQPAGKDENSLQAAQVRNKQMRILLVGHTDDTGSSGLNADLSEERARAIAQIFAQHGFTSDQIFYQGAGEVFPIDDNRTEAGRARNRRVEIVDLSDDAAFAAFLAARRPNVAHYRPAAQTLSNIQVASKAPTGAKKSPEMKESAVTSTPAKAPPVAATSAPPKGTTKVASIPTFPLDNIDFGGKPANGKYRGVDIGKTAHASSFSIISSAYAADDSPVGSCATDRPRISRGVKSLGTGQMIKTSEYLPGAATASWGGKVNGHLVGLSGVSVLRDGGQPASRPTFYIWKNFVEGSKAKADLKTTADVNAYQGEKALLYRVFVTEGPVRCLDMVIPNGSPNTAPASSIVYERSSALYQTDYSPTIVR